jgi:acyl carrier protein phosphodiesterase
MNFLAHLWLADRTGTSLAGSVLGDVARGSDLSAYPDDLAHGIHLHRRVDARTDHHPLIVAARSAFAPGARRYAGIVLDLACDHALARDWRGYSNEPLDDFCLRAGTAIADASAWFHHAGGRTSSAASFAALLRSYQTPAGIDLALQRIAQRMSQPDRLIAASTDWPRHALALRAPLPALLDDLVATMQSVPTLITGGDGSA